MLRHKMSLTFKRGHDIELAKKEAREQWMREVEGRDHDPAREPYVRVIHTEQNPVSRSADRGFFRVSVIGDIVPKNLRKPG